MQGLLSVAAQNVMVTLSYPLELMQLAKQYGEKGKFIPGKVTIPLRDLFSEDRKGTLLQVFALKGLLRARRVYPEHDF